MSLPPTSIPAGKPSPRIDGSIRRGGTVTVVGQLAKTLVQLASLVTLSRLLSPHDFGLIALMTVFVMLGELLRDFGLTQAAMQAKDLSPAQASNLFWTNMAVGVVLALALTSAAPILSSAFNESALRDIAPFIALSLVLNAAQAQYQVQLARSFRFVALTTTDLAAQVLAFGFALTAALLGAGHWALVIQILVALGSLLTLRALASGWVPSRPTKGAGMRELYRYGLDVGLAQLVAYGAYNTDSYIIGFRYGATPLGVYSRAFQLLMVPFNQLLGPLTNVVLPVLSRERHATGQFSAALLRIQASLGGYLIALFAVIAGLSAPIVEVALGSEWTRSGDVLRILSLGGAVQVLSYIAYWAFLVTGRTRQLFWQNVVTKVLLGGCVAVGASSGFGIEGVAAGYSVGLAISWPISLVWLARSKSLPGMKFGLSGVRLLAAGGATGMVSNVSFEIIRTQLGGPTLASTAAAAGCGVLTFVLLATAARDTREPLMSASRLLRKNRVTQKLVG